MLVCHLFSLHTVTFFFHTEHVGTTVASNDAVFSLSTGPSPPPVVSPLATSAGDELSFCAFSCSCVHVCVSVLLSCIQVRQSLAQFVDFSF